MRSPVVRHIRTARVIHPAHDEEHAAVALVAAREPHRVAVRVVARAPRYQLDQHAAYREHAPHVQRERRVARRG